MLLGLGIHLPLPFAYTLLLNVISVAILAALSFLAYRRYFIDRHRLTHMTESGIVLSLIAGLMITNLLEHVVVYESFAGGIVWWLHFLILMTFPSLIAYGKHLHLIMAPVNVVLPTHDRAPRRSGRVWCRFRHGRRGEARGRIRASRHAQRRGRLFLPRAVRRSGVHRMWTM